MDPSEFVGLVPAAGGATRLGGRLAKELLPLIFISGADGAQPRPVVEHTLRAFVKAGIAQAIVVTAPNRPEHLRVLGDGSALSLSLAYVVQERPDGLPGAVLGARPWFRGRPVCLGLPDTVFAPSDAVRQVCARVCQGLDLVLGVFPTDRPCELGPVRMSAEGVVEQVLEKPSDTELKNTWGLAAWRPSFSAFLAERYEQDPRVRLGEVFDAAVQSELQVGAIAFTDGSYVDVGSPTGLADLIVRRQD